MPSAPKYILVNKNWGFLVKPDYPSLWRRDDDIRAYRFNTREEALKESLRWAEGIVEIVEVVR